MLDALSEGSLAALIGLFGGVLLGLAARIGRFCTLGAIEDMIYGDDDTRLRMWGVAIGVSVFGTFLLVAMDLFNPASSIYMTLPFSPVASVAGGLVFGYGMALAGNCGYGALARLGGGDLRNFVIVLVMGIAAMIAANGPLAAPLLRVVELTTVSPETAGIAHYLSGLSSLPVHGIGMGIGLILVALMLMSSSFRKDRTALFWSVITGLAIVSAWAGTGWVADRGFGETSVASHTFAAPIGRTMIYIMTASAGGLNFAVGSVLGVLLGAFIGSLFKGHFRWEACEDPRELRRQILGAALMGFGAVLALGCSVGQGLSAFSVLSVSAPIVVLSILVGTALGLRQIMYGLTWMN